jgi:hypothetical protein
MFADICTLPRGQNRKAAHDGQDECGGRWHGMLLVHGVCCALRIVCTPSMHRLS